jgi:hypothetical protein
MDLKTVKLIVEELGQRLDALDHNERARLYEKLNRVYSVMQESKTNTDVPTDLDDYLDER